MAVPDDDCALCRSLRRRYGRFLGFCRMAVPNTPPSGLMRYFHTKTIRPPQSIPASAPCQLQCFQNRAHSTTAPKAPPKPAHAKLTMPNTLELGSRASTTPTTLMQMMVRRAANRLCFSVSFMWPNSCRMFWDTLEAAASIWLSAVDMVAARMPARIRPARMAASTPCWAIRLATRTIRVSLEEPLRNSSAPRRFCTRMCRCYKRWFK